MSSLSRATSLSSSVQGLIPIASLIDPLSCETSDRMGGPQVRHRTESLRARLAIAAGRVHCRTGAVGRRACGNGNLAPTLMPHFERIWHPPDVVPAAVPGAV